MKLLILCLFLSATTFANFALKTDVENGAVTKVYTTKPKKGDFVFIPSGYGNKTHKVVAEMIDDTEKPIWATRSLIEICEGEEDCKLKLTSKKCVDGRHAIYNAEFTELWCNKITRYEQKESGREIVVIDEAEKAKVDAERLIQASIGQKVADMDFGKRLYASVQVLNRSKGLSKSQRRSLRQTLKIMRDDLFDGNICEVREDLVSLASDGSIIKEEDKLAVIAQIDSYKSCI